MSAEYERIKAHRAQRRVWAVEYLGGKCVICGTDENLHFDHRDPATKVIEIANAIAKQWALSRLIVELDKCQLLCRPHHVEKSATNLDGRIVAHGGGKSGKRGCSCGPCKTRKSEYMAARYQAMKPGASKLVEESA